MNRKIFCLVSVFVLSATLVLNLGYVQAQTPGQIPMFDQTATGFCNSAGGNDCIDSVITQDASGNIGIGTPNPGATFDVVGSGRFSPALSIGSSPLLSVQERDGRVHLSGNSAELSLQNRATQDFVEVPIEGNRWVWYVDGTPTNGSLRAWSGSDKLVINRLGNVGIGTTPLLAARLHVVSDVSEGVLGVSTNSIGVDGRSTNSFGVRGSTGSPTVAGVLAVSANASSANLGLEVIGRFTASGTKSAVVPLQDGQHVSLYAEESTEVWFSDYGNVQLVNGLAVVQIDREFLQTVNTAKDYHVFLTARGNPIGALYIDNETPSSFEIRESTGTANIKVSYRIVAKRKDFADERLKRVTSPYVYGEPKSQSATSARDAEGMKRMAEEKGQLKSSDARTAALP